MTERPILFNGEMVRAILDGRKTVTRRVVKPAKCHDSGADLAACEIAGEVNEKRDFRLCPYGQPGDRLWVREAHAFVPEPAYRRSTGIYQRANPADDYEVCVFRENFDRARSFPWRPSIHMPRWASRILLEVTDIRVERLHEITIGQICKEGLARSMYEFIPVTTAFDVFAELWNSTGGDWDANPWVWVIEFKRIES